MRLAAQAKGGGMISPNFATMLCFVQTDAALSAETADLLTGVTVKRSFDRISVDGQLSTNDAVFLMANGASGVEIEPQTPDELALGEALDALLRQLAVMMVADGEGASRVGRVVVTGSGELVEPVARSVANSPLVKTALFGSDPNFGRILQAVGQAMAGRGAVRRRPRDRRAPGGVGGRRGRPRLPGRVGAGGGLDGRARGRVRGRRSRARAARPRSSSATSPTTT